MLDAECRDSQGIKYTLDEVKNTAMIGNYAGGLTNTSGSAGSGASQGGTSGEGTSQQPGNQPDAGSEGTETGNAGNQTQGEQEVGGESAGLGTNANSTVALENLNHLKPDLEPDDKRGIPGKAKRMICRNQSLRL